MNHCVKHNTDHQVKQSLSVSDQFMTVCAIRLVSVHDCVRGKRKKTKQKAQMYCTCSLHHHKSVKQNDRTVPLAPKMREHHITTSDEDV